MASLAEGAAYFAARGAGLRDARCRHGGRRDGGAAPGLRIADATTGRGRHGRRARGRRRESGRGASIRHDWDASTSAANGAARRRSPIWRWCCRQWRISTVENRDRSRLIASTTSDRATSFLDGSVRALNLPRVAVVSDLREERWHSMDLVAEMLLLNAQMPEARFIDATELRPTMVRRLTRLPLIGETTTADIADRILNRVWDYPRWIRSAAESSISSTSSTTATRIWRSTCRRAGRLVTLPRPGRVPRRAPGISMGFDRPTGTRHGDSSTG